VIVERLSNVVFESVLEEKVTFSIFLKGMAFENLAPPNQSFGL